ncbi:MAG: transketolase, partial [Candidatus Latescibacterota bacterium]
IGLGEDGPTHQPIEHLPSLRAVPNLTVIRPADATETAVAWEVALENRDGPIALILTRQKLPIIDREKFAPASGLRHGAYVLVDPPSGEPEVIMLATGSEVHLALEAYEKLTKSGIATRVVNMPSQELFEKQPQSYRDAVLPPKVTARVAIEASYPQGWDRYVEPDGDVIGITTFGASAPGKVLFEKFGFTVDNVISKVEAILEAR